MNIGYARVSTDEQRTAAQVEALEKAGCEIIYRENKSGGKAGRWDRPELHKALERIAKGDVLVVWKLDRLSRSLGDLLNILVQLEQAGAGFKSLTEALRHHNTSRTDVGRGAWQLRPIRTRDARENGPSSGWPAPEAAGRIVGARFKAIARPTKGSRSHDELRRKDSG
jgi:hypothetical protein